MRMREDTPHRLKREIIRYCGGRRNPATPSGDIMGRRAKPDKRTGTPPGDPPVEPTRGEGGPLPGDGFPRSRWKDWAKALALLAAVAAFAWGTLCIRASAHLRDGDLAARDGKLLEAARSYESAIGCYAPLNPFSHGAAERMLALGIRCGDPALAAEIRGRLARSIRSVRWITQPYTDLLIQTGEPPTPFRDPDPALFFLSLAGLLFAGGSFWAPRLRPWTKIALCAAGFSIWGVLLYLC